MTVTELIKTVFFLGILRQNFERIFYFPTTQTELQRYDKSAQNYCHKISEAKRFVRRPWRRWEDNIESDLK
jgi:hypothetical protein